MSVEECRVCLKGGKMTNIFDERNSNTISAKIMSLAKVQIHRKDGLPETICRKCLRELDKCIAFVQLCECSDGKLRKLMNAATESKTERLLIKVEFEHLDTEDLIKKESPLNAVQPRNFKKKAKKQQCSVCGKILSSGFRLKHHLRTHSGERPFPCSQCNKSFGLKSDLALHTRIHTGEKPLKCEYCEATFRHPSSVRAHQRIHTGDTPYHCTLCPKRFHTASHLQYHMRLHTGEKNFGCNFCDKAFVLRGHLKDHLLSHTGERPHICPLCGVKLSRVSHLKRHIKHIHNPERTQKEQLKTKQNDGQNQQLNIEEISLPSASDVTRLDEK